MCDIIRHGGHPSRLQNAADILACHNLKAAGLYEGRGPVQHVTRSDERVPGSASHAGGGSTRTFVRGGKP